MMLSRAACQGHWQPAPLIDMSGLFLAHDDPPRSFFCASVAHERPHRKRDTGLTERRASLHRNGLQRTRHSCGGPCNRCGATAAAARHKGPFLNFPSTAKALPSAGVWPAVCVVRQWHGTKISRRKGNVREENGCRPAWASSPIPCRHATSAAWWRVPAVSRSPIGEHRPARARRPRRLRGDRGRHDARARRHRAHVRRGCERAAQSSPSRT